MKKLGIFGRGGDPIATHLEGKLRARGAQVLPLDLSGLGAGSPITWDGEEWLYEGEALSECHAFFLRKIPAETVLLAAPEVTATAELWYRNALLAKERAHVAQGLVMDLELAGKRVINGVLNVSLYDQKPLQLAAFKRLGLRIPRTLITNFPAAVKAFVQDVGEVIYKPTAGGAETQVVTPEALGRISAIAHAPVIFQERIRGPDIRVTLVDGRIISSVELPTEAEVDYRADTTYQRGGQRYVAHALPSEIASQCILAAKSCGQILSGVDLKRTASGEYVFLEANSSPVYLDIELKTGAPITDAIADALLRD
ncbi:MAG: hypothetical protein M3Y59_19175 [Myxococcota bacterium]|nr:hypothetical protein [Myxococcota bacterium]